MHQNSWQEKAVLITGGCGSVGKTTAGRFLSEGANVMLADINETRLKGTYFKCSRAIPELKKTRGCIVNLSSDAGLIGLKEAAIYCASKGGVVLLTKALALELAPDLVRVNAVCPTEIMTSMLK
jgi:NAD(P)-dependent dehydrogenase (short-subunit alcohol dehydrogenase family)